MLVSSGNARIVKRKINDDLSFSFSIVRHLRIMGRSCNTPLATIGTYRQSEFDERASEFWATADKELTRLVNENKLWSNDREKVEKKFAAVIPRPAPAVEKEEPYSETNLEIMKSLIVKLGESAERKLRERGIDV